jgi:hypothetical protein
VKWSSEINKIIFKPSFDLVIALWSKARECPEGNLISAIKPKTLRSI